MTVPDLTQAAIRISITVRYPKGLNFFVFCYMKVNKCPNYQYRRELVSRNRVMPQARKPRSDNSSTPNLSSTRPGQGTTVNRAGPVSHAGRVSHDAGHAGAAGRPKPQNIWLGSEPTGSTDSLNLDSLRLRRRVTGRAAERLSRVSPPAARAQSCWAAAH